MAQMEHRKISELTKLSDNPRIIKDKEFKDLCESIKRLPGFFDARPIIISDRTGKEVVIAGNQRLEAAKANKMVEVPAILLTGLSEAEEREITIRDNTHGGEWDMDALANGWGELPLNGWGVDVKFECLSGSNEEKLKHESKELKPYNKIHVLVSVDVDSADDVTDLLDKLRKIEGVEIEQGAN